MLQRDEEARELRTRVELLMSENRTLRQEISTQVYSRESGSRFAGSGRFSGLDWIGRGFGSLVGGVTSPKPISPPPRSVDLRPPPPPPAEPTAQYQPPSYRQTSLPALPPEPPGISRPNLAKRTIEDGTVVRAQLSAAEDPTARVLDFGPEDPTDNRHKAPNPSPREATVNDPMSVVLTGMAQLQGVVADLASSPKQARQEVIKPGVNTLPELPVVGPESCLHFADWIHSSRPALSDVSDTSEELWALVLSEARAWYKAYLRLDAVSRLTSKPIPSEEITQPKWARVSRRIETMILAACPAPVREEISAARVTGLLSVVARLYVIYAPGGLAEREIGLRHIQDPSQGTNVKDTVDILRRWSRWCDRMKELGGTLPDSALRVKALEKITRVVLQANPDVAFRVNLTRAALQVDTNPDDTKVEQLHAQMLGELETIVHRAGSKDQGRPKEATPTADAKVKGVEDNVPGPKNPKGGGKGNPKNPSTPKANASSEGQTTGGTQCTFFMNPGGCKKGADCTFVHNWQAIPAAERPQRCRNCGAKGHRAVECKAGMKGEEKAKHKMPPSTPKNAAHPKGNANNPSSAPGVPPPPKEVSQQQIKTMLSDAAQILQQAVPVQCTPPGAVQQAVPISSGAPPAAPGATGRAGVTQGTPVTLESLNAQIDSLRAMAQEHEVRMISLVSQDSNLAEKVEVGVRALLDSGATHAVVPYTEGLGNLERVDVTLAGDSKEEWFKTSGGTLVVPPSTEESNGSKLQTILPLGALVQTLGCKVSWSKRKGLKVSHPRLGPLRGRSVG